jgi:hypothetical protein
MLHKPVVTLDVADNRLDNAGYVKRWYPSDDLTWLQTQGTNVWRLPKANIVTLQPVYPLAPAEAALSRWTQGGTGVSYKEITGCWGTTGATILQQSPTASLSTLTSTTTPDDNQPFYCDFYLHSVAAETWYADIKFSTWWDLRLLYDGTMQLWHNYGATGAADDWRYVDSIKAAEKVFNEHIRIGVFPTAHQELYIAPVGFDPLIITEADPLVTEAGGVTYRTIAPKCPVRLRVTSGAFYFSYRYMQFATAGNLTFPLANLPWEYDGAFALESGYGIRAPGYTPGVTTTLVDKGGSAISSPPAAAFRAFAVRVDLSSNSEFFSPELHWSELRIDPTSKVHTTSPTAVPAGGNLLDLSVGASIDGRREALLSLFNRDDSWTEITEKLHLRARMAETATVLWEGYLSGLSRPAHQDGRITAELKGSDPLDRLDVPLSDSYVGDGKVHTAFVEEMFKWCGLGPADYVIVPDPSGLLLPEALGPEKPLFQARDGKTVREMVEYIGKVWSGYEVFCSKSGVINYAPRATTGAAALQLIMEGTAGAGELKCFDFSYSREEENFYNYIVVIGMGVGGRPLMGYYYNDASINDPTAADYLGFEKLLLVVDSNLRTMTQVETALGYIVAFHGYVMEEAEPECDWNETLDVGDFVSVSTYFDTAVGPPPVYTYWTWQIRGLDYLWNPDARTKMRLRRVRP